MVASGLRRTVRTNDVTLLATTTERVKYLWSETEAKAWVDTVAVVYAQHAGISVSSGATAGGAGGATVNSKELIKSMVEHYCCCWHVSNINIRVHRRRSNFKADTTRFDV